MSIINGRIKNIEEEYRAKIDIFETKRKFLLEKLPFIK